MEHLRGAVEDHPARRVDEEAGFSTAELLGNAALGIVALVVIWGALQALGLDIVDFIRTQLGVG